MTECRALYGRVDHATVLRHLWQTIVMRGSREWTPRFFYARSGIPHNRVI
ncbi:hypothetical protein SXCC_04778 [Gluconacetobacter sp. SXCC-1]|nr:hypothetical protein SXCC_04778 [Gluconacetobacter sp. SXCC-1]